jgi:hypothetical protein
MPANFFKTSYGKRNMGFCFLSVCYLNAALYPLSVQLMHLALIEPAFFLLFAGEFFKLLSLLQRISHA